MSLRLTLENYIRLFKESGELDAFLPLLLTAMGHVTIFKPQTGVRQYGVDVVTKGNDDAGTETLFLWLIKCGNIDRSVWSNGNQAIRPSIDEVEDVYLQTHVPPEYRQLPKKLVVLTNGDIKQEVNQEIVGYLGRWATRTGATTQLVNGALIAQWTENYLLSEYILPEQFRSLFRKALANVETPEISYRYACELTTALFSEIKAQNRTKAAQMKQVLLALRAVLTFNTVLSMFAREADNLEAAYLSAEFALLSGWSHLHDMDEFNDRSVSKDFSHLISHYLLTAGWYHEKLAPFYCTEASFAYAYPNNVFVVDRVFEELGRLGLLSLIWNFMSLTVEEDSKGEVKRKSVEYAQQIDFLLETHTVSGSPCFDCQAVDISLAMLALVGAGKQDRAHYWLSELIERLAFAKMLGRYTPIDTDSFDDLIAIRYDESDNLDEFSRTSTLIPVLAIWCLLLKETNRYERLIQRVVSQFTSTTFNTWLPDTDYSSILADKEAVLSSGYGEGFHVLPATLDELNEMLSKRISGVPELNDFHFHTYGIPWIALMSSRHWKTQVPHIFLPVMAGLLAPPNTNTEISE